MARAAPVARPAGHPRKGRNRAAARPDVLGLGWGVLLAMGLGMVLGLCVVATGLFVLAHEDVSPAGAAASTEVSSSVQTSAGAQHGRVHSHGQPSPARIDIQARHLGNLELEITSSVTMSESGRQLTQGDVVAYTDMVEMPTSHRQGPIPLREVPNRPGVYTARAKVPMAGNYDVSVEVRQPVRAKEREVVLVATVPPQGPNGE